MVVFRLCTAPYAALDGEGARLYGGRWNSAGHAVIYTSAHLSLAVLEYLIHLELDNLPNELIWLKIKIPDNASIETLSDKDAPSEDKAVQIGNQWLSEKKALALVVPSAVISIENNILLNPHSKEMKRVKVLDKKSFLFDPRLFKR